MQRTRPTTEWRRIVVRGTYRDKRSVGSEGLRGSRLVFGNESEKREDIEVSRPGNSTKLSVEFT